MVSLTVLIDMKEAINRELRLALMEFEAAMELDDPQEDRSELFQRLLILQTLQHLYLCERATIRVLNVALEKEAYREIGLPPININ